MSQSDVLQPGVGFFRSWAKSNIKYKFEAYLLNVYLEDLLRGEGLVNGFPELNKRVDRDEGYNESPNNLVEKMLDCINKEIERENELIRMRISNVAERRCKRCGLKGCA